jgi:hypothetical protein
MPSKELTSLEKKIQTILDDIENRHLSLEGYSFEEYDDTLYWWFRELYATICVYLELKNLPYFLDQFRSKLEGIINKREKALQQLEHDGFHYYPFVSEVRLFLSPFKRSTLKQDAEKIPSRLNQILAETNLIVNKTGTKVTNETSVYKCVHWVLQLYYPSCRRRNNARFISQFKSYRPDILIPELRLAVEFKLARPGDNIDNFINQLKVDSENYKGDPEYNKFIAVLCLLKRHETSKSIDNSWKSKSFPPNWKLITASLL